MIGLLIPTLKRAANIQRVLDDLAASGDGDKVEPIFIVEADDADTIDAIETAGSTYLINRRSPSYAGAINTGIEATTHGLLFVGADDVHFHEGWLDPLVDLSRHYGFIGTNDLHNPEVLAGNLATHYLVTRAYTKQGTIDGTEPLLHEGYAHNYCDTEATATAKHRGQFRPCLDSVVEHLHWAWGLANMDDTYHKGARLVHQDEALFRARSHLWA